MTTEQILMVIAIIAYLVSVVAIGVVFAKRNKNTGDFYLGGRKLGPLVTAMSAEASDMSGWLLMGLPGTALAFGFAEAVWTAIGLAVGTYINWLIVAKRLRNYSQVCGNSITLPEFFSNRFRDTKKIITLVSAAIILVFFVPYTGSGFAACGKLFGTLFGVDYHMAMIISAVVIIAYTTIGGFLAASTSDFIQSIIMTVALVAVVIFGISQVGSFGDVITNAESYEGYFSFFTSHNAETGGSVPYDALTIVSTLAWGLGYFGMPHVLLRFMAIDDSKKLKTSRRVATIWVVISLSIAIIIGVIGRAMIDKGVFTEAFDSETIIVKISDLLSTFGPVLALLAGLIIAGILASTMSTSDSQLLAASSAMSENLIHDVFKVKLNEKVSMLIARITVVVIAVIGVVIAWDPDSSVFDIVSFAWAGFGATFGPVMLLALFWKRANKWGAFSGMLVGGVTVFLWKFVISTLGGVFAIYELLPAFIIGLLVNCVVSVLTEKPTDEMIEEFEKVKAMK